MKNTHVISFDWGSVQIYTEETLFDLLMYIKEGQVLIFQRYKSDGNKSEILVNMKLVGCIYPLDK